jgi:quercetin dioxygenase-like cupin family protein
MRHRLLVGFGMAGILLAALISWGYAVQDVNPSRGATDAKSNAAVLPSKAFLWEDLEVREQATGKLRPMFRSPTATLDELEMHATQLNPGQRPHPPHQHPYEEMLVLREGTLEATVNERVINLSAGSVLFIAPNDLHGWQNKGTTPANYYIITWRTPRTASAAAGK